MLESSLNHNSHFPQYSSVNINIIRIIRFCEYSYIALFIHGDIKQISFPVQKVNNREFLFMCFFFLSILFVSGSNEHKSTRNVWNCSPTRNQYSTEQDMELYRIEVLDPANWRERSICGENIYNGIHH